MIKPGDLFFTTSSSIVSWFIRQRTWGEFSHVQVIVNAPQPPLNLRGGEGELDVISADGEGVTCRNVREGELIYHAILTYPQMTDEERQNVVKFCFSQIGKPYDFVGLGSFLLYKELQNDDRWFCSELAYVAYKQAGIRLIRRVKQDFVSPRDLFISPLLKPVDVTQGFSPEKSQS